MVTVLTLCSANYLAHAKTLGDSVLEQNPDFHFVIGLVDRIPKELPKEYLSDFEVIPVEDFEFPEFQEMVKKYNIVELNTAVKPFYMDYLYRRDPTVEAVIYLDPDTCVYGSFSAYLKNMKANNLILTPHSCTYDNSPENIHYETVMLWVGVYNLGILGTSRSPVTDAFLKWWKIRLYDYCYYRRGVAGSFFDQLWMGLAQLYFTGVYVETDPGYNFCYWNQFERRLTIQNGKYVVNDKHDLILVHFSGYKPENPTTSCSGPTNPNYLPSFDERPDVYAIYEDYHKRLIARNYFTICKLPWCFTPPQEALRLYRAKQFLKKSITGVLHVSPRAVKSRLKRLAQFVVQHS